MGEVNLSAMLAEQEIKRTKIDDEMRPLKGIIDAASKVMLRFKELEREKAKVEQVIADIKRVQMMLEEHAAQTAAKD